MNPKPWNPQGFISHGDIHFSPSSWWLEAQWNQHWILITSSFSLWSVNISRHDAWQLLPLMYTSLLLYCRQSTKTDCLCSVNYRSQHTNHMSHFLLVQYFLVYSICFVSQLFCSLCEFYLSLAAGFGQTKATLTSGFLRVRKFQCLWLYSVRYSQQELPQLVISSMYLCVECLQSIIFNMQQYKKGMELSHPFNFR